MLKKLVVASLLIPFSAFVVSSLSSFTDKKSKPQKEQILRTIIVDAGHGIMSNGGHNGAKGTYSYEDDICLAIAKKLVADIRKEFPDIKVIETRPDKYIVDLHERADIANQNKGDLFISIHVNAMPPIKKTEFTGYKTQAYYVGKGKKKTKKYRKVKQYRTYYVPNTTAKGTQTYIWGAHKGDDKEIAVRENAPMLSEENYKEKYGEVDVNSPEFIALSLAKTLQFQRRSTSLANLVEEQFSNIGRISGGPKQRQVGIWVLQATAMPSILVETGFITNPSEEDYLNSDKGQDEIAFSITNALKNYKAWLEKKQLPTDNKDANSGNHKSEATKNSYSFLQTIEEQEKKSSGK